MYIYPNTTLRILRDVNLNSDYDHTIWFDGKIAQTEYFLSKTKYTLSNQSYQRKERGWMKVDINQNNLWDCTYLMFQNTSYNNKWFYAFILSVEYVNDSVSLINFQIDVMQTWHFDYILDKCFVEREHSLTDNLFENLVDEGLDIGDDYNVQIQRSIDLTPSTLVVLSVDNFAESPELGYVRNVFINNYYYPLKMYIYDLTWAASKRSLQSFMDLIVSQGQEQAIIQIYQVPGFIRFPNFDDNTYSYTEVAKNFVPNFVNIDGYVPKNNKLFNYPYNFLSVNNREGNDATYKWELWDSAHRGEFNLIGTMIGKPSVLLYPMYYREIADDYESGIFATDFPQNPWAGDAWQLYWAQHGESYKVAQSVGGIKEAIGVLFPMGSKTLQKTDIMRYTGTYSDMGIDAGQAYKIGGVGGKYPVPGPSNVSSLIDLAGRVAGVIAFKKDLQHYPNQAYGQANADILNMLSGNKKYSMYQMTIKSQFARIIDEYFSRFGYACHRIKEPNRKARKKWTYTKTVGCELNGNIPSDDMVAIKAVFDHGITFWDIRNANVGEYGDFTNPIL